MSDLRARLEALRAACAEAFDAPGLGLVEALLGRAEALAGAAGERLLGRAEERLGRIEEAFGRASAEARAEIEALGEHPGLDLGEAREALTRGDPRAARRAARRAKLAASQARERIAVPWAARLGGAVALRGEEDLARELAALCEGGAVERSSHAQAVALGEAASAALLRGSMESARATIAIARSADNLPEHAGPYNGQVLAARALSVMAEISPAYARAVVAAVDDLAALDARLGPEAPKAKARPARKKRAAAG